MTVEFHPEFESDLESVAHYYEDQRPGLGEEFLTEVFQVIQRIQQLPLLFPKVRAFVRAARLRRFGAYSVRYYVIEETDTIRILSVLHAARNPDVGADRI